MGQLDKNGRFDGLCFQRNRVLSFFFDSQVIIIPGIVWSAGYWSIDNIRIEYPKSTATLALQLQEGPSVRFTTISGTTPVRDGDIIEKGASHATVFGAPIVSNGSWAGGDAQGTIVLKKMPETFSSGDTLELQGGATRIKLMESEPPRPQDNFIKVFVGSSTDGGSSDSALDANRRPLPRGTVKWPPRDISAWSPYIDYFTLVQWDAVNENIADLSAPVGLTELIDEDDYTTVIRTNSLQSTETAAPELGLHAVGNGATDVYFDDFGVQTTLGAKPGLPYTIQR